MIGLRMDTLPKRESLPAVTAAGVIAILFGVFGALGSLVGGFSLLLLPQIETAQRSQPMPPGFRAMSLAMMFFVLALAVFGIFVGVGVIRRRNWARITILVWAAFMTLVSLGAITFSLLIFGAIQTQMPNVNPVEAAKIAQFMRIFVVIFYGIPACTGIWWLILFTRKRVAAAFTNPAEYAYGVAIDASGFPRSESTIQTSRKPRPACPLPIAIFSVFLIFSSACMLLFLLFPMPASSHYFSSDMFLPASPLKYSWQLSGSSPALPGLGCSNSSLGPFTLNW